MKGLATWVLLLLGGYAAVWPPKPPLDNKAVNLSPPEAGIPATFFGVNMDRHTWDEPVPPPVIHSWRSGDTAWWKVEPQKGVWKFEHSDKTVADAAAAGAEVDFILTSSPTWAASRPDEPVGRTYYPNGIRSEPADLNQWAEYVRTVAQRYKGRVHLYETWNEPNTSFSYSGDVSHMVALCRVARDVLKKVDPGITVISPGFSPEQNLQFVLDFLTTGGGESFDVFGYHFYTEASTPEQQVTLFEQLQSLLHQAGIAQIPIWNTESGYLILTIPEARRQNAAELPKYPHALSQQEAEDFLVRAYVLGWALHMQRFFWYAWGDNHFALVDDWGQTRTPAVTALQRLAETLTGATMLSCSRDSRGIWVVRFRSPKGSPLKIVWSDSGEQTISIPTDWQVSRVQDVLSLIHI